MTERHRQKKADRLLHREAVGAEVRCDYLVGPLDELARQMDRKWGVDRLPELVSPQMAGRYGQAMAGLKEAIIANDPAEVEKWVGACIRGLRALDAEAERLGAAKADPDVIQYEIDGWKFGVLPNDRYWPAVQEAHPELPVFTLRQIGMALKAYRFGWIDDVRKHFPDAELKDIRPKQPVDWENGGDAIPFGKAPPQ